LHMTANNQDLTEPTVEDVRDELNAQVRLGEYVEELAKDDRFKELIIEGFIENVPKFEAINLISGNEIIRDQSLDKIKAAKYLEAYLDYVVDTAGAAKYQLSMGAE
jgi:hypothetical protein